MSDDLHRLRNIGVIAHIDAGKTTVTERMLFYSGFSHRVGEVDKGTTVTDYDPEEQERGITINAAAVTFPWKNVEINLIDTPGHVDFTAEVERSLRVLDGGVVVFSAREGVEAQSETVWHQADKYRVPRIAFINKMDREGADYFGTLDEIRERLGCQPIPVNLPVGAGPPHLSGAFRGLLDLISMRMLVFTPESKGAEIVESEIPAQLRGAAELWRGRMLDRLSVLNDELTELMLAEETVPASLIRKGASRGDDPECGGAGALRLGVGRHRRTARVGCRFALPAQSGRRAGRRRPRSEAARAPLAVGQPVRGTRADKLPVAPAKIARRPSLDEPFCGLVFKIQADRHGDLHYVRVYSGVLKANSRVYNPGKDKKENVPQLWHPGRPPQPSPVGLGRRDHRHRRPAAFRYGRYALQPTRADLAGIDRLPGNRDFDGHRAGDLDRAQEAGRRLGHDETAGPHVPRENEETGQTLISGMGELHLEVIKHRLLRNFRLDVRVHKPRVSYRETIGGPWKS